MFELSDFYETADEFVSKEAQLSPQEMGSKEFMVKAHEKTVYALSPVLILAQVHRDNGGTYPFSKADFLSHKITEVLFPGMVPQIYAGNFARPDTPYFVLQRIALDPLHMAFNMARQQHYRAQGLDFRLNAHLLSVEAQQVEVLATEHWRRCAQIHQQSGECLKAYGIEFDNCAVNISWTPQGTPIFLEVHKARRDYLLDRSRLRRYLEQEREKSAEQMRALTLLNRLDEVW